MEPEKLEAVHQALGGDAPIPAHEVRTSIAPIPGGYSLSAIIPWKLLGEDAYLAKICFEVIANVVDRESGGIVQVTMSDLPSDGWNVLRSHLAISTPNNDSISS